MTVGLRLPSPHFRESPLPLNLAPTSPHPTLQNDAQGPIRPPNARCTFPVLSLIYPLKPRLIWRLSSSHPRPSKCLHSTCRRASRYIHRLRPPKPYRRVTESRSTT